MNWFSDLFQKKKGAEICRARGQHRWGPEVYDGIDHRRWERYCCDCLHGQFKNLSARWKDQRPDKVLGR